MQILILEDSKTQAQMLKDILEQNNFAVTHAFNGREALKMLEQPPAPELIISDIIMPEMDGYEFCKTIKRNEKLSKIPLILLTSLSGVEDVINGLESGADNFIIKPYQEKHLLERVNHIVSNLAVRRTPENDKTVEVLFNDQKHIITSQPHQIIDFMISTYETAVYKNEELSKAEEELKRSNEELERFAYVASHDLQEPLRVITGYLDMLKEANKDKLDKESNEYINTCVNAADHMRTLIQGLMEYSRVTSQSKPFTRVDLEKLLDKVLANLKMSIEENKAVITCDKLPSVWGDELQLNQLFQNLIGNGIKYHGEDVPRINISVEDKGKYWQFCVKDNGIGFDQKYADQAFEIFRRLPGGEAQKGTGIGLAICKKIVERHRGEIWAKGFPGKGAEFYFTLPNKLEASSGR